MSSSPGNNWMFLDCPFEEKDQVKELGAKWDTSARKWYIETASDDFFKFQQWLPRLYLKCSYEQKDEVKQLGAKWDAKARHWYIPNGISATDRKKFSKWLPKKMNKSTKSASKSSKATAMLARVNADMTVAQLREECLARNPSMKGLSSKNKQWLLDHLGVGSVWIHQENQTKKQAATPAKKSNSQVATPSAKKRSTSATAETSTGSKKVRITSSATAKKASSQAAKSSSSPTKKSSAAAKKSK
jgi:hypothetical protein